MSCESTDNSVPFRYSTTFSDMLLALQAISPLSIDQELFFTLVINDARHLASLIHDINDNIERTAAHTSTSERRICARRALEAVQSLQGFVTKQFYENFMRDFSESTGKNEKEARKEQLLELQGEIEKMRLYNEELEEMVFEVKRRQDVSYMTPVCASSPILSTSLDDTNRCPRQDVDPSKGLFPPRADEEGDVTIEALHTVRDIVPPTKQSTSMAVEEGDSVNEAGLNKTRTKQLATGGPFQGESAATFSTNEQSSNTTSTRPESAFEYLTSIHDQFRSRTPIAPRSTFSVLTLPANFIFTAAKVTYVFATPSSVFHFPTGGDCEELKEIILRSRSSNIDGYAGTFTMPIVLLQVTNEMEVGLKKAIKKCPKYEEKRTIWTTLSMGQTWIVTADDFEVRIENDESRGDDDASCGEEGRDNVDQEKREPSGADGLDEKDQDNAAGKSFGRYNEENNCGDGQGMTGESVTKDAEEDSQGRDTCDAAEADTCETKTQFAIQTTPVFAEFQYADSPITLEDLQAEHLALFPTHDLHYHEAHLKFLQLKTSLLTIWEKLLTMQEALQAAELAIKRHRERFTDKQRTSITSHDTLCDHRHTAEDLQRGVAAMHSTAVAQNARAHQLLQNPEQTRRESLRADHVGLESAANSLDSTLLEHAPGVKRKGRGRLVEQSVRKNRYAEACSTAKAPDYALRSDYISQEAACGIATTGFTWHSPTSTILFPDPKKVYQWPRNTSLAQVRAILQHRYDAGVETDPVLSRIRDILNIRMELDLADPPEELYMSVWVGVPVEHELMDPHEHHRDSRRRKVQTKTNRQFLNSFSGSSVSEDLEDRNTYSGIGDLLNTFNNAYPEQLEEETHYKDSASGCARSSSRRDVTRTAVLDELKNTSQVRDQVFPSSPLHENNLGVKMPSGVPHRSPAVSSLSPAAFILGESKTESLRGGANAQPILSPMDPDLDPSAGVKCTASEPLTSCPTKDGPTNKLRGIVDDTLESSCSPFSKSVAGLASSPHTQFNDWMCTTDTSESGTSDFTIGKYTKSGIPGFHHGSVNKQVEQTTKARPCLFMRENSPTPPSRPDLSPLTPIFRVLEPDAPPFQPNKLLSCKKNVQSPSPERLISFDFTAVPDHRPGGSVQKDGPSQDCSTQKGGDMLEGSTFTNRRLRSTSSVREQDRTLGSTPPTSHSAVGIMYEHMIPQGYSDLRKPTSTVQDAGISPPFSMPSSHSLSKPEQKSWVAVMARMVKDVAGPDLLKPARKKRSEEQAQDHWVMPTEAGSSQTKEYAIVRASIEEEEEYDGMLWSGNAVKQQNNKRVYHQLPGTGTVGAVRESG